MSLLLMHQLPWASPKFKGTWCYLRADRHLIQRGPKLPYSGHNMICRNADHVPCFESPWPWVILQIVRLCLLWEAQLSEPPMEEMMHKSEEGRGVFQRQSFTGFRFAMAARWSESRHGRRHMQGDSSHPSNAIMDTLAVVDSVSRGSGM